MRIGPISRARACGTVGVVAVALLALARPASAEEIADAIVAKIDRLSGELRYDEASVTCDEAFRIGGFTRAQLATLSWRCAVVAAIRADGPRADGLSRLALCLDASRSIPDAAPPRVIAAFDRARAWWAARPPLQLRHLAPATATIAEALLLVVEIESDPLGLVKGARGLFRAHGDTVWTATHAAPRDGAALAVTFPAAAAAIDLEYYFEVLDERGSVVAEVGDRLSPLRLTPDVPLVATPPPALAAGPLLAGPPRKPLAARWWFWPGAALLVGVLTGAAIAAAFAARPGGTDIVFRFESP